MDYWKMMKNAYFTYLNIKIYMYIYETKLEIAFVLEFKSGQMFSKMQKRSDDHDNRTLSNDKHDQKER